MREPACADALDGCPRKRGPTPSVTSGRAGPRHRTPDPGGRAKPTDSPLAGQSRLFPSRPPARPSDEVVWYQDPAPSSGHARERVAARQGGGPSHHWREPADARRTPPARYPLVILAASVPPGRLRLAGRASEPKDPPLRRLRPVATSRAADGLDASLRHRAARRAGGLRPPRDPRHPPGQRRRPPGRRDRPRLRGRGLRRRV